VTTHAPETGIAFGVADTLSSGGPGAIDHRCAPFSEMSPASSRRMVTRLNSVLIRVASTAKVKDCGQEKELPMVCFSFLGASTMFETGTLTRGLHRST